MAVPTLATLTAMLMLVTAGCIGDDAANDDPLTKESADSGDPSALASTPDAAAGETVDWSALAPVVVPVVWDGSMATHATVCEWQNVGECVSAPPGAELDNELAPELPGPLVGGSLTLSWEPSSPLTEQLAFLVMAMLETEEGMEHPLFEYVEGASPLVIEFTDAVVPPDAMVHLWVGVPSHAPDPLWMGAAVDQAFHVEGTLTAMPMDDAPMAHH